jgi:hypothetical protein
MKEGLLPQEHLPSMEPETDFPGRRVLVCARCSAIVTSKEFERLVGGHEEHSFVNPHGYPYRIRCYSHTTSLKHDGELCELWSWFPGYAWQIANCAGCSLHLGWRFVAEGDRFWGLILSRLLECERNKSLS